MPSGGKELVIHQLERAVSTDHGRLQAFAARDRAEIFRWMLDVQQGADDVGPVDTQVTTLTSPLQGDIIGGLLVRPQSGGGPDPLSLLVDPGVAWVVNPDGDTDASVYKLVSDPGLNTLPGALLMTANSSGSTRIDVVECQYTLNTNAEIATRDVFNPATGAFASFSLSKATQAGFTYRVRLGTPGAGFPGTASGWLPLAVASVPTGTTTNSTITFWDVRPVVSDRPVPPFANTRTFPTVTRADFQAKTSGGTYPLVGLIETNGLYDGLNGVGMACRLGGIIGPGGAAADLKASTILSGSVTNGLMYVYLACPFGLPRWVTYNSSVGLPEGNRGLLIFTTVPPQGSALDPEPSAPLTLPSGLGLGGTTSMATCVAAVAVSGGAPLNCVAADGFAYPDSTTGYSLATGSLTGPNSSIAVFSMTPNGSASAGGYPSNAKEIEIAISTSVQVVGAGAAPLKLLVLTTTPGNDAQVWGGGGDTILTSTSEQTWRVRIPVPLLTGASPWTIALNTGLTAAGTATLLGATLFVTGWRI
jgi:hypothetical protein